MIKVKIFESDDKITRIQIKGHAKSNEYGKDLVCAGVSSIAVGILNTIEEYQKKVSVIMDEGLIDISVLEQDYELDIILNTLIIQLKTIKESYSKYIRIEKEV